MSIVNLSDWRFEFSNSSIVDEAQGITRSPTILSFPTSADLVEYLANEKKDDYCRIHSVIQERLDFDPVVAEWKRTRSLLKNLDHFPNYRRSKSKQYHRAAVARHQGLATQHQLDLVAGLEKEIKESRTKILPGQILFHGSCNASLISGNTYPTFVSASLHAVVARYHAYSSAGANFRNGTPTVYVLTMCVMSSALWGHAGKSNEYELLLPTSLTCRQTKQYSGANFDVIEAEVC